MSSAKTLSEHRPAISVVVPAHNAAQWIGETLASVAGQTIDPDRYEVIVVDDGSIDGTADVAEKWLSTSALRWRVIRQQNRGPGAARNVGWQAGRGDWIQFLDADDLLAPEKFAVQLRLATADPTPAVIVSKWAKFGNLYARWEDSRPVVYRCGSDPVTDYINNANAIATGCQLFSRSSLENVGGWDERFPNGEDHELNLRIAFAGGRTVVAPSERALFYYRRHASSSSLSTRSGRANAEVWLRLAKYVEEESRRRGELSEARLSKVLDWYVVGACGLADYDLPAAQPWIDRLLQLDSRRRPTVSPKFSIVSRLLGFRRALWLRVWARRLMRRRPSQIVTIPAPDLARPHDSTRA